MLKWKLDNGKLRRMVGDSNGSMHGDEGQICDKRLCQCHYIKRRKKDNIMSMLFMEMIIWKNLFQILAQTFS